MSYKRVLPRDAFNEANLLKCVGRLALLIEDGMAPGWEFQYDGEPFDILQDPGSGATYVANVAFKYKGQPLYVFRPLNSKEHWPLYAESETIDTFGIFTITGELVT